MGPSRLHQESLERHLEQRNSMCQASRDPPPPRNPKRDLHFLSWHCVGSRLLVCVGLVALLRHNHTDPTLSSSPNQYPSPSRY